MTNTKETVKDAILNVCPAAENTAAAEIRIYVGSYQKYAAGSINGAWLDLSAYADRGDFLAACKELHSDEEDPELMYQDFEGFPRAWYHESEAPPAILWEWLRLSDDNQDALAVFADNMGGEVTFEQFMDCYQGSADSEAEFSEQLANDCGDIPKNLADWIAIDWQASWDRTLRFNYWAASSDQGGMHFFINV